MCFAAPPDYTPNKNKKPYETLIVTSNNDGKSRIMARLENARLNNLLDKSIDEMHTRMKSIHDD